MRASHYMYKGKRYACRKSIIDEQNLNTYTIQAKLRSGQISVVYREEK